MSKKKTAKGNGPRIQIGRGGNVEIVIPLTPDELKEINRVAEIIGTTPADLLLWSFRDSWWIEDLEDMAMHGWSFETRAACKAAIKRAGRGWRNYIPAGFDDGTFQPQFSDELHAAEGRPFSNPAKAA